MHMKKTLRFLAMLVIAMMTLSCGEKEPQPVEKPDQEQPETPTDPEKPDGPETPETPEHVADHTRIT